MSSSSQLSSPSPWASVQDTEPLPTPLTPENLSRSDKHRNATTLRKSTTTPQPSILSKLVPLSPRNAPEPPAKFKRLRLALAISAIAWTQMGCASLTKPSDGPPLPASLLAECQAPTSLDNGTGRTVLNKIVELAELYNDCASKHKALVQAVSPATHGKPSAK